MSSFLFEKLKNLPCYMGNLIAIYSLYLTGKHHLQVHQSLSLGNQGFKIKKNQKGRKRAKPAL